MARSFSPLADESVGGTSVGAIAFFLIVGLVTFVAVTYIAHRRHNQHSGTDHWYCQFRWCCCCPEDKPARVSDSAAVVHHSHIIVLASEPVHASINLSALTTGVVVNDAERMLEPVIGLPRDVPHTSFGLFEANTQPSHPNMNATYESNVANPLVQQSTTASPFDCEDSPQRRASLPLFVSNVDEFGGYADGEVFADVVESVD